MTISFWVISFFLFLFHFLLLLLSLDSLAAQTNAKEAEWV